MSSTTSMDEVVNILCKLSILHCKVLFEEAERFEEWLKEKVIKDKDPISTFLDIWEFIDEEKKLVQDSEVIPDSYKV
ncbi:hypothetical protein GLOIN_2v1790565 [Rhizophagus irregularis DAOM 181602=DAOM 197198]|uniref:Uncharacterized protein n=1 Tax=Rhizophagus irregularis (strain DAOM 181602 / DAOM 197198 / MUCL 43194) TaxID=747089 RepID=A0A2P4NYT3_RHIID|nr:hypothetical protein GLOIN_2v1790565 [Rhizophagus irregularis DAOM 181602=DAOM 197198]POG58306.1 hypothetical protein GLOIN_2v1790565 [Rhizophagus irregularis DAOM 181602=DAOM 197198]|eukprot:XP_025165172.1 hypothetical protein GLOIN_2v1790565 [Rhizophagus irregularis DAOM 181602=DAOM 197198]